MPYKVKKAHSIQGMHNGFLQLLKSELEACKSHNLLSDLCNRNRHGSHTQLRLSGIKNLTSLWTLNKAGLRKWSLKLG